MKSGKQILFDLVIKVSEDTKNWCFDRLEADDMKENFLMYIEEAEELIAEYSEVMLREEIKQELINEGWTDSPETMMTVEEFAS